MKSNLERNKDGTIKGICTMGDFIVEDEPTESEKKTALLPLSFIGNSPAKSE